MTQSHCVDLQWQTEITRLSGQPISLCYQCQRCTSGCLPAAHADYTPNQIIRLIQYGARERVLRSRAIWLCSSCYACDVRCPNGINISDVMDVLKEMAITGGLASLEENAPLFHRLFVKDIRRRGRVHEAVLMARYKLRTGTLWDDLPLALRLYRRGKLPVLASTVKQKQTIRRLFHLAESSVKGGRTDQ